MDSITRISYCPYLKESILQTPPCWKQKTFYHATAHKKIYYDYKLYYLRCGVEISELNELDTTRGLCKRNKIQIICYGKTFQETEETRHFQQYPVTKIEDKQELI